jgi:hypothetical protein
MKNKIHLQILQTLGITVVMVSSFFCACRSPQNQPAKNSPDTITQAAADSLIKQQIYIMVDSINAGVRRIGMPNKLPYGVYNPADTIFYWIVDGASARISIAMSPPEQTMWPTFFIYKGEMVMVRFRYYNPTAPQPYTSESMIFLRQGKIVYCEERRMELKEGEMPGLLKQKPYTVSTRTPEEIEKDYKEHWKAVSAYMREYNAIPPVIASALLY